jgi:pyruvate,water dikinase
MAFVASLSDGVLSRAMAGGKGAALSDLTAAGFRVPAGFVVLASAYKYFTRASGIDREADDAARTPTRNTLERLQGRIETAPLPEDLESEIIRAYEAMGDGVAVAVRSSATNEDSANASFAGMYESYLNLRGPGEVTNAVRRCYASLWSERAVRLRAAKGIEGEAMAVVVMKLVPAEAAGVAFTAHPVSGDRDVLFINASFGLGEAVVSGRVTPDAFVVAKDGLEIREREVYSKDFAIVADEGGGTREVTPSKAEAPSITDAQAIEVARLAIAVEAHTGTPQDIEWAYAAGDLWLLQSRAITTL